MPEGDAASRLPGAWSLLSWKIFGPAADAVTEPFGSHPVGLLQYTADGWMSAAIGNRDRASLAAGASPRRMPPEQLAEAYLSYFHYAGHWRIEGDAVIHSVKLSLNPNMVGTEQVRQMDFAGDRLTLTGIEPLAQGERRHVLLWQRAGET
jgi:hypothetical protein